MKIVIAGAGAVGTHLARMLSNDRQDVVLIDADENKLFRLLLGFFFIGIDHQRGPFDGDAADSAKI